MTEIWRRCPGHEGLYEISDLGNVKRVARGKGTAPGRLLRPRPGKRGYMLVTLTISGISHPYPIHSLVCEAFNGPRPSPKHGAAHNDGDKLNNAPTNLRWATHAENMADKNLHGTHNKGSAHPLAILSEDDIPDIRWLLAEGVMQKDIAMSYGVHRSTVNNIAQDIAWKHV